MNPSLEKENHRGHHVEGQWVFGGIERECGKILLVPVENRNTDTLIAVIKQLIRPGTTIILDSWMAYDTLEKEGYKHLKVNNSVNFVNPDTGAHTNSIKSTWRHNILPQYCRLVFITI